MVSVSRLVSKDCSLDRNQPDLSGEDSYEGPTCWSVGELLPERPGDPDCPGAEVDISLLPERPSEPPCLASQAVLRARNWILQPLCMSAPVGLTDTSSDIAGFRVGEHLLPNGDLYSGSLLGNMPESSGKYIWSDGCIYEGEWRRGMRHGHGKTQWPSGAIYDLMLSLQLGISSYGQSLSTSTFIGETIFAILIAIFCLVLFAHLIGNMQSVALSVGDWFFDRVGVSAIDCPYPCDNTCHNLVFK
ncbi:hypothetical protein Syun_027341 [Stephania yunnanensis]|uniref:Pectin acetylesterase n=1 Tax=Stephania yunnanensis TaxID=152371 RepID=A0AAP0HR69_9MAGN